MDQINPEFPAADVVLVLGANDVVNPQARAIPTRLFTACLFSTCKKRALSLW